MTPFTEIYLFNRMRKLKPELCDPNLAPDLIEVIRNDATAEKYYTDGVAKIATAVLTTSLPTINFFIAANITPKQRAYLMKRLKHWSIASPSKFGSKKPDRSEICVSILKAVPTFKDPSMNATLELLAESSTNESVKLAAEEALSKQKE